MQECCAFIDLVAGWPVGTSTNLTKDQIAVYYSQALRIVESRQLFSLFGQNKEEGNKDSGEIKGNPSQLREALDSLKAKTGKTKFKLSEVVHESEIMHRVRYGSSI